MRTYSYQLYSSRNFPPLVDTLAMLVEAGYGEVEGFGGVYDDPAATAAALKAAGLAMTSGHFSLEMLETEPQRAVDIAGTLGLSAAYCPHIAPDQRPDTAADWREFGARVEAAGAPLRAAGLIYGWHNHDFEFAPLQDGETPMAALLHGGPSLDWEVDAAWIVRAGADPLAWMTRYANRVSALHIKDIAAPQRRQDEDKDDDEDGWADVGHGVMDWAALLAATKRTRARFFIMEHDNPSDHARFARRSLSAVRRLTGDLT